MSRTLPGRVAMSRLRGRAPGRACPHSTPCSPGPAERRAVRAEHPPSGREPCRDRQLGRAGQLRSSRAPPSAFASSGAPGPSPCRGRGRQGEEEAAAARFLFFALPWPFSPASDGGVVDAVLVVAGSRVAACGRSARRWTARLWCAGMARSGAATERGCTLVVGRGDAAETTACMGWWCVLATASTGAWTAATTSPPTSLSMGATPDECAGAAAVGSRRSASEIDAAASAAGKKAVVAVAWSFILGAPVGRNDGDRSEANRSARVGAFPAAGKTRKRNADSDFR